MGCSYCHVGFVYMHFAETNGPILNRHTGSELTNTDINDLFAQDLVLTPCPYCQQIENPNGRP